MKKHTKIHKKVDHERRKDERIHKNFILSYFDKAHPDKKYELTQLKNIGKGGMCFVTSKNFEVGTGMGIELHTPYLAETTYLNGVVLESHEKAADMLYETRLQFENVDPQAEFLLMKLIEFFINGEKTSHE